MKSTFRAALGAALLGSAVALAPGAFAEDKLTREVQNDLAAAQKLIKSGDYQGAIAKIKEAQGVSDLKPYDTYMINSFLAQVYIEQKDYTDADAPLEAAADSPAMPEDQKKGTLFNAFQLAMNAQHFQKAITYGEQLQAMNALDARMEGSLALAYYETKDTAKAQQMAQKSIDAAKAAGQAPDENVMKIVENSEAQNNDVSAFRTTLENMALTYNKPDTWAKLVDLALQGKNVKDADALYLLRLIYLIPDAMAPQDYPSLASVADQQSYSTEAYNVLQKGISSGKITAAQAGATLAHSKNGAAIDERGLPEIASSAERSKTGQQDIKLAEDYWGYGRFADAEAAARRAISKGGMKDPSEGPMVLGMVLVAEGKYDDAIQTLGQVSGSPGRMATAHLWTLYAQAQKKSGGAH